MKLLKTVTGLIAPPISRMVFPKGSDKGFEVDEQCNGCGLCVRVCPSANINLEGDKPKWLHNCARCTACLQMCPKYAVQFGNSRSWGRYQHPKVSVKELMVE